MRNPFWRWRLNSKQVRHFFDRYAPDDETGWSWLRTLCEEGYSLEAGDKFTHFKYPPIIAAWKRGKIVWQMGDVFTGESPQAVALAVKLDPERAEKAAAGRVMTQANRSSDEERFRQLMSKTPSVPNNTPGQMFKEQKW